MTDTISRNIGNMSSGCLRDILDNIKASRVGKAAGKIGRLIWNGAKFTFSSLLEAVEESAERLGVPAKRSYWKENLGYAILTLGLVAVGAIIGASDLFILADGNSSDKILSGWKVPKDVSFFPPQLTDTSPIIETEPKISPIYRQLNLRDYLSLAAPLILFCVAVTVNVYKYRKWRNPTGHVNLSKIP